MLNFILGACGTGKSYTLIKKLKKSYDNNEKCIVIVPDQFSFEYDKKMYDILGAETFNDIDAFSFSRLTRDIFLTHGGIAGEYADDLTKSALMHLAIIAVKEKNDFLYYNRQYKNPEFISNMLNIVKEFKWSDLQADKINEIISDLKGDTYDKTSDILSIYKSYEEQLKNTGKKDSLNDVTEAAKKASQYGYFKNTEVFIDEFQSFSKNEYNLLEVIIAQAKNVYITLPLGENGNLFSIINSTYDKITEFAKDYNKSINITTLNKSIKYKYPDVAHLSLNVFNPKSDLQISAENVKIYEAQDMYSEVDFVATEIRHLVDSNKYKYGDISVVAKNVTDYSTIIETAFLRYNIPVFMDFEKPLKHKSIILLLKSTFEIAVKKYPSTECLLKYLKTGLVGISEDEISILENYAYKWSIDGKLWFEPFNVDTEELCIEETRRRFIEPLMKFKKKVIKASGQDICKAILALFTEIKLEDNINSIFSEQDDSTEILRETKQLWNMVCDILDKIYAIVGENHITISEFNNLFLLMISGCSISTPPQVLDSVIVSSTDRARLNSPKIIFIIGAVDGQFPASVSNHGLLNDRDREKLKTIGLVLESNSVDKINIERFTCYTALSSATEKVYIVYPLLDATGKNQYPSYLLKKIQKLYLNSIKYSVNDISPLYFCTTKKAVYYTYIQQYLRKNETFYSIKKFLEDDEDYSEKIKMFENLDSNKEERLTDKSLTEELFGKNLYLSSSRFEDYNKCPFVYFCKKGLSLYPLSKVELSSLETGNIIHYCMYELLKKYPKDSFLELSEEEINQVISTFMDDYYNKVLGGNFAKSNKFIFDYKRINDILSEIVLHLQKEFSQCSFIPADFELSISNDSDVKPLHIKTNDGRHIYFSGKVDRVDIYEKDDIKYLRVIDYKSGIKKFKLQDVCYGINMQMLLYLFAITAQGKYQDFNPAGVLYMPSKELDEFCSRDAKDSEIEKTKCKQFKMNGIIIDNKDVASAMEKDNQGIFVPVKISKDEFTKSSSIISANGLEKLKKHCESLLTKMADELYGGNISAIPLSEDGVKRPCTYCEYNSICGKNMTSKSRVHNKEVSDKFINSLGGDDDVEKMD